MKIHPVILAGGSGTRLWPLSREYLPKPFIPLVGDGTMFQQTLRRIEPLDTAPPVIVCNEAHRFLALDQMRELSVEQAHLVIEPVARNTAPALTLAALDLQGGGRSEDDALMLVLPADHLMQDEAAFHGAVQSARKIAQDGFVVTFGVVPSTAHTGYGYIRKGRAMDGAGSGFAVSEFVEKPGADVAAGYVESGKWLWNSGMFMLRASAWLSRDRPPQARHRRGLQGGLFERPQGRPLLQAPAPLSS